MSSTQAKKVDDLIVTALSVAGKTGMFGHELDEANGGNRTSARLTILRRGRVIKTAKRVRDLPGAKGGERLVACYWLPFYAPEDATFGDLRHRKPKAKPAPEVVQSAPTQEEEPEFDFELSSLHGALHPGDRILRNDGSANMFVFDADAVRVAPLTPPSIDFTPASTMAEVQHLREVNAKLRAQIAALLPDPMLVAAREAVLAFLSKGGAVAPWLVEALLEGKRDGDKDVQLALLAIKTYAERPGADG